MAARVLEHAVNRVRQPLCTGRGGLNRRYPRSRLQAVEAAAVGPQPQRAGVVLGDGGDGVVREALLDGVIAEDPAFKTAQPARGANPERAGRIPPASENGADEVTSQTIHARKAGEFDSGQVGQPMACPDPQAAVAVSGEGSNEVVGQAVGSGKSLHPAVCMEQVEPVGGANPEVAVPTVGE